MKVLERKEWEKDFSWQCHCPQCEASLLAESSDLCCKPGGGDSRDSWPEEFSVICPVCQQGIFVPTKDVPKYIQKLTRDRYTNR